MTYTRKLESEKIHDIYNRLNTCLLYGSYLTYPRCTSVLQNTLQWLTYLLPQQTRWPVHKQL